MPRRLLRRSIALQATTLAAFALATARAALNANRASG